MNRGFAMIGLVVAVVALAVLVLVQDGAAWRIPDDRQRADTKTLRAAETEFCAHEATAPELVTCAREVSPDGPSIYVWGDSHARHLIAGLSKEYPTHNIRILYFTSCLAQSGIKDFYYTYEGRGQLAQDCRARNQAALKMLDGHASTNVILHQYFGYDGQFSTEWIAATDFIAQQLATHGHHVMFIGGVLQPGEDLVNCRSVPALISDERLTERCAIDEDRIAVIFDKNASLEDRWPGFFINPNKVFCKDRANCGVSLGDTFLFRDSHHLSVEGSQHFIETLSKDLSIRQ